MSPETRLDDLLHRWEDARQRGQPLSPDELCRDCPELLEPLRRAIAELGHLDPLLGTIPPPAVTTPQPAPAGPPPAPPSAPQELGSLPDITLAPGVEPVPGYRLVKFLGGGGFGKVWRAEAPGGFAMAMKFVDLTDRLGAAELQSLAVLRRARHPNILTVFSSWCSPSRLILAMELADGTLDGKLNEARQQGRAGIPGPDLLDYLRGAAAGLDYLNQPRPLAEGEPPRSIQHRDVKPANILLVAGAVKVADFGLARVMEKTVASHSGGLTPAFAAPEFFRGQATRQSDQYSLAVTYCMLRGGRLPFEGSQAELMLGHIQGKPDLSMLPAAERPAVARALSKTPEKRWPSCGDFVEALARAGAADRPPPSHPTHRDEVSTVTTPPPRPPAPPERPRRLWVAPLAALLVIGTAAALLTNWGSLLESLRPPRYDPGTRTAPTSRSEPKVKPEDNLKERPPAPDDKRGGVPPDVPKPPDDKPVKPPPADPKPAPGLSHTFAKHTKPIRCAAWVPWSSRVLTGGEDGELWLWDARKGEQEAQKLVGHQGAVNCLAVSDDGRRALSGGGDGVVCLWDLKDVKLLKTLRKKTLAPDDVSFPVHGVAFAGDGRAVSAGQANLLILWDLKAGAEADRQSTVLEDVLSLAGSRDGSRLLLGGKRGWLVL